MSRSNPNEGRSLNPATRRFEWNGEKGVVRYYDREAKRNVEIGDDFTFLLLDQVGTVRGWHDASDSAIYSNEVKDTRQETMIVKAFKGGTLAEGLYREIKDRVNSIGGQYVANCYIAFRDNGGLAIGVLGFKGAALMAWSEFCKVHRNELLSRAIRIQGYTEGKKGRITYRMPVLDIEDISPEDNSAAVALDKELQKYFDSYFKRATTERVEAHKEDEEPSEPSFVPAEDLRDIPF